jgi:hypothetical protein
MGYPSDGVETEDVSFFDVRSPRPETASGIPPAAQRRRDKV